MPNPEKQPHDDSKPELGAILPDSPPPSPADVFSNLDDYQKRIEQDWESAKNAYKDKIDRILDDFIKEKDAGVGSAAPPPPPPSPRTAASSSPSTPPSSLEDRMEHLLERVERTLHDSAHHRRPSWLGGERPPVITIPWTPLNKRRPWMAALALAVVGAGLVLGALWMGFPSKSSLPYVHPSTLVFTSDRIYIVDWFRKVLYQHSYKSGLPILQVENIPNNFITGCALSDKYLWTLDGFNNQILQHNLNSDHRVIKQFPAPGKKPAGLFWDGVDLWSSDAELKKVYRHYGADPETVKNEYSFTGLTVTSLYYHQNRLWILDAKSRMVHLFRLEDPLRSLATYDLDSLLKGATPTDFMGHKGKFWMLTEGPPQLLKFSKRTLEKMRVN